MRIAGLEQFANLNFTSTSRALSGLLKGRRTSAVTHLPFSVSNDLGRQLISAVNFCCSACRTSCSIELNRISIIEIQIVHSALGRPFC